MVEFCDGWGNRVCKIMFYWRPFHRFFITNGSVSLIVRKLFLYLNRIVTTIDPKGYYRISGCLFTSIVYLLSLSWVTQTPNFKVLLTESRGVPKPVLLDMLLMIHDRGTVFLGKFITGRKSNIYFNDIVNKYRVSR